MAPGTGDTGRHTRRDYLKVAGGAGAASLVAGCMGGGGGGGGGSGVDLTIGGLIPQSGPLSFDGPNITRGAELAIADFQAGRSNLDGSPQYVPDSQPSTVGEIDLIIRDTESAADAGMRKTRELVNSEGANVLFGGYSSSFTVNLAQYTEDEEIITVVPASANTQMTGEYRNKWFFHAFGNADQTSRAIGNFLLPRDGWGSVFLVFEDYAWGQSWKAGIENRFEAHGTELVGTGPAQYGTSDYSSYISQAMNSDADAVIGAAVSATNFLKQASQLGLREEKNLALGFFVLPYGQGVTQQELAGAWAPSKYYFLLQNENNRNFVERYYAENEQLPTAASAAGYKSMMELLKSYEEQGDNPEDVSTYMEGREFTYFKGEPEYYRECDHQLVQPIGVGRGYQERPDFSQFNLDVPDPTEYALFETVGTAGGRSDPGLPACEDLAGSMD